VLADARRDDRVVLRVRLAAARPGAPVMPGQRESAKLREELAAEHYTGAEVARLFGVDPATVAKWRRRGKLTGIRLPGGAKVPKYIYRRAEVDALARARPAAKRTCQACGAVVDTRGGRGIPPHPMLRAPGREPKTCPGP
jgi:Helix-turn-helix domain